MLEKSLPREPLFQRFFRFVSPSFFAGVWMRFCSILEPNYKPKRFRNTLFPGFDFAGVFLLTLEWFFVDFYVFFRSSDLENSMVFTVWIASWPICRSFAFGARKNVKNWWKIPSQIPPNHSTSDSENELFFPCVFFSVFGWFLVHVGLQKVLQNHQKSLLFREFALQEGLGAPWGPQGSLF